MESFHSRDRSILAALAILIVFILASSASAQGLFGVGLPSLPSFGGQSQEPFGCGPTKSVCGPLTFYAGWGWDRKGTTLSVDLRRPGTGLFADDLGSIINTYPVRGLWLGLEAQANLTGRVGLFADFWAIVPANQPSNETFTFADVGVPSGGKTWNTTNTDWWFVDGALTCDTCGLGKLLAGFRYDRFATNFKDASNFVLALGSPDVTGDVTINCYIPFVGLQVNQGIPGQSKLMFRVIGFPWVGGDVKYHDSIGSDFVLETDRIELAKGDNKGYFLEAFAEYGRGVFGRGEISLFARWNMLHGSASRIPIVDVLGGFPLNGQYKFAFDRQCWTVGGSISLGFNLPL